MKIAFYGSSLLSSYWNGAATYYRGLLSELARFGYEITFYEPDAFDRQQHRDIEPPDWARVVVYPATHDAALQVIGQAMDADVVVKASGVGVNDDALLTGVLHHARSDAAVARVAAGHRHRPGPLLARDARLSVRAGHSRRVLPKALKAGALLKPGRR